MLINLCGTMLSGQKLTTLIYHQVLPEKDPIRPFEPDITAFGQQMKWVKQHFNVLSATEALACLQQGALPPRSLLITFDDGYRNNATHALPVLQHYGLNAVFFIASDFLHGGIMWNDIVLEALRIWPQTRLDLSQWQLGIHPLTSPQQRLTTALQLLPLIKYRPLAERRQLTDYLARQVTLPRNLMMDDSHLRQLQQAGMEIGGHTCSHPILSSLTQSEARQQIVQNKQYLETLLQQPLLWFAYPNGKPGKDYTTETRTLLQQAGYQAAFSTSVGVAEPATDRYQLPRYTPWRRNQYGFLLQLLNNYRTAASYAA
ncbi:polysaccharide deacetylase family protein [Chromatiaceae bacterium AAb-1]|nr:polysaccharide deacetylase family protein [Chromatiaceae bacterium AAb-1]